jgi:hypothetical protein
MSQACVAFALSILFVSASAQTLVQPRLQMDEYLFVLQQIAPAARDGAEAYLQAFARRCGRPLDVAELRRLVADGDGDPVLMQMMRAAQTRDHELTARLGASIRCASRSG